VSAADEIEHDGTPPPPGRTRPRDALRAVTIERGVSRYAEGSAAVHWGNNRVIATVSVEARLPPHVRARGTREGWLTAEYAMIPRATHERRPRERHATSGRTQEIQRLVGRSLRAAVDLSAFANRTLTVDVDVLQADGGTRCAAILAGYAALHDLADAAIMAGTITEWPLRCEVGAVSVGLVADEVLIDLDYVEDARADVDLNVVATAEGDVIAVQGGGEGRPVDAETYVKLVATGVTAVQRLLVTARAALR
jgi:ribonuclease PH